MTTESSGGATWTVMLCSVAVFLIALEITIISVALPEIEAGFPDSSRATLSWIFTAYNVGVASLMLIGGWLAERHGRKRIFMIGLIIFGIGSVVTGLAPNVALLIAGRVVQSIGGAALMPASLALILHTVAEDRRDWAIGVWGAMAGLAAAIGPTLGALLVEYAGWRWVFLINVPIVAVAYFFSRVHLVETRNAAAPTGVDVLAPPVGAAGIAFLVYAIVEAGTSGLLDPLVVGSAAIGLVLVTVFVVRTVTHRRPLFPPELTKLSSYRVGAAGSLFFGAGFAGWLVLAPTFLGTVWGYSVLRAGFAIAPAPIAMAVVAGPAGNAASKRGYRSVCVAGAILCLEAIAIFVLFIGVSPSYLRVFLPGAIVLGLGVGMAFPMLTAAGTRDVPEHQYAVGAAGITTVRQVAMAIGISLAVAIVGTAASAAGLLDAFRTSWATCGMCFALTAAVMLVAYPYATRPAPSSDVTPVHDLREHDLRDRGPALADRPAHEGARSQ